MFATDLKRPKADIHIRGSDGAETSIRQRRTLFLRGEIDKHIYLSHGGDALRWLWDVGAGFVQIDSDGRVIAAAGPVGLQDARLRRSQAQAAD